MASRERQLADGHYLRRARTQKAPPPKQLARLFDNLLLDFERRLTAKIYDANRTVTALASEVKHSVVVENVPELVFELGMKDAMGGRREAVVRTVEELIDIVPAHSLVRKHYAGDFCVCVPLLRCINTLPAQALQDLPTPPFSPNFDAQPQEIFVALKPAPFSDRFVEVFSPYPGPGSCINPDEYPPMRLTCGEVDFVFPPRSASAMHAPDDAEDDDGNAPVELIGVKNGDVGCAAAAGALTMGETLMVRKKLYKVVNVTGGGMPCELYGGADLIVFDKAFPFNARKAVGRRCLPVVIRAKHGFLPAAALANFEPVKAKFTSTGAAHKLGMGAFQFQFCGLAFNEELVCHRDSALRPGQV